MIDISQKLPPCRDCPRRAASLPARHPAVIFLSAIVSTIPRIRLSCYQAIPMNSYAFLCDSYEVSMQFLCAFYIDAERVVAQKQAGFPRNFNSRARREKNSSPADEFCQDAPAKWLQAPALPLSRPHHTRCMPCGVISESEEGSSRIHPGSVLDSSWIAPGFIPARKTPRKWADSPCFGARGLFPPRTPTLRRAGTLITAY